MQTIPNHRGYIPMLFFLDHDRYGLLIRYGSYINSDACQVETQLGFVGFLDDAMAYISFTGLRLEPYELELHVHYPFAWKRYLIQVGGDPLTDQPYMCQHEFTNDA